MTEVETLISRWNSYEDEDIEPTSRLTSCDVIPAAEELKFLPLKEHHIRARSIAQEYAIPVHTLKHIELETTYSTSLKYGLNYNQVTQSNIVPPLQNTKWMHKMLKNYNTWSIFMSIIFSIVIICIQSNIMVIIFTVIQIILMLIAIILLIITSYISNKLVEKQCNTLQSVMKQKIPVIRHLPYSKKELLIEGFAMNNRQKYLHSDVLCLIIKYCTLEPMIDVEDLVQGDIIKIKAGDRIPADLRIIECSYPFVVDQIDITGDFQMYKYQKAYGTNNTIDTASNICFYNADCISGEAKCMVFDVGENTLYYRSQSLDLNPKHKCTCAHLWSFILVTICCVYLVIILLAIHNVINSNIAYIMSIIWFCISSSMLIIILSGTIIEISICKTQKKLQCLLKDKCNIFFTDHTSSPMVDIQCIDILFVDTDDKQIGEMNEGLLTSVKELGIKMIFMRNHIYKTSNSSLLLLKKLLSVNALETHEFDIDFGNEYIFEISSCDFDEINNLETIREVDLTEIISNLRKIGYKVGIIGNSFDHRKCFKQAHVAICINDYASVSVKKVADVICLEAKYALESIIYSIKISKDFMTGSMLIDSRFNCLRLF
eukprot:94154_1